VRQIIPVRVPDPASNLTDNLSVVLVAVVVAVVVAVFGSGGSGSVYGGD